MKRQLLLGYLAFLCSLASMAQQFPVQVFANVIPPAPVHIYNYADAMTINSPLRVRLLLRDLSITNRRIRLKVYIEGNGLKVQSRDQFIIGAPLFIDGGSPLVLNNTELAPYFELRNLQGIGNRQYGQTLREGAYQFCFEVYDFFTNRRLSRKSCATTFIFNNDPPLLNIPFNKSNIEPKAVDNIVFQWTPRQINVSNVEYEFSLVEIWDDHVDPNTAFLTSPPIFTTTTRATSFIYGPAHPLLLHNKRYAWRVQAKALKGSEEIGLFRNEGKSEVFWFSKNEKCPKLAGVHAEPKGISKINVYWEEDPATYSEYTIMYRQKDRPNSRWFHIRTNSAWATVWDLKPNTTYEYKVAGKCKYQYGEYSPVQYVTTGSTEDPNSIYNCGIVPEAKAITNREGHPNLVTGDRILAGDFMVVLTDITSQSNGVISGSGFVRIPYLEGARFGVVYENILINTDEELAEGEIVTLYDPEFGKYATMTVDVNTDVVEVFTGDQGGSESERVDFVIASIDINEYGAVVVTGTNGEEEIIPGGKDMTIVDGEGTPWTVGEDGTITQGEAAEGGTAADGNTEGMNDKGLFRITAKGVRVDFKEPSGYYCFDPQPKKVNSLVASEYETLMTEEAVYVMPYKLISDIPAHTTDILTAEATFSDASITPDMITFKTKDGVKIPATWKDNTATLELKKKFDYVVENVIASVRPKDSTQSYTIAGACNIVHVASAAIDPIHISLVPIAGGAVSDQVVQQVKELYQQVGVQLNIRVETPLDIPSNAWDRDGNNVLDIGDSNMLAHYTEEERAIYTYYKQQRSADKKRYYIFVVGTTINISDTAVQGFMPLKRQYGFVFAPTKPVKTIAHELGHGIFGLKHPWDTHSTSKGSTNWLMDNGEGTLLTHMDWKKIHAPALELYTFQDDEDGELGGEYWLTPDWKPFTVAGSKTIYVGNKAPNHVQGAVPGFILNEGTDDVANYYAKYDEKGQFLHYYSDKAGVYTLATASLEKKDKISVFRNNGGCNQDTYYKTTWGYIQDKKGTIDFTDTAKLTDEKVIECNDPATQGSCDQFTYLSDSNEADQAKMAAYGKQLNMALATALSAIDQSKATEIRTKGNFGHIQFVNPPKQVFTKIELETLEDKLHLLSHYKPDTYMVVSVLQLDNTQGIQNHLLNQLATESLTANAGAINGRKVVHVVITYADYESILGVGFANNNKCYNIGFAQNNATLVQEGSIQTGVSPFEDVVAIYSTIEKPLYLYVTIMQADGTFLNLYKKTRKNVRGYGLINALGLLKSPYYDKLKAIEAKQPKFPTRSNVKGKAMQEYLDEYEVWKSQLNTTREMSKIEDQEAIAAKNTQYFKAITGVVKLREVYITEATVNNGIQLQYAKYHFEKIAYGHSLANVSYMLGSFKKFNDAIHMYEKIDTNSIIYNGLDAASLFLAPVGLDIIPDTFGFLYAVYHKDVAQASGFAVGIVAFSYAEYAARGYKLYQLVKKTNTNGEVVELLVKNKDEVLKADESVVTAVSGRSLEDARNLVKAEGVKLGVIDDVGSIVATDHMIALGTDLEKTITRLSQLENKTQDDVLDLVIHGSDQKLLVDGKEIKDVVAIKEWLAKTYPNKKTIRLLSCNNIEGAQTLANTLGDGYKVHATDGYIRIHNDGAITTVPREIGGDVNWYQLTEGKKDVLPDQAKPRSATKSDLEDIVYADDFLELSTRSAAEINWATLQQKNPDLYDYISVVISKWNDIQKDKFKEALSTSFIEKLANLKGTELYSKDEALIYEIISWTKNELYVGNIDDWNHFVRNTHSKGFYFKTWRYVLHMKSSPSLINVSLGMRDHGLVNFAKKLNSTSMNDFYTRGFISNPNLSNIKDPKEWLPLVLQAVKKSYDQGGKIYFHLDGLDIKALYQEMHPNFNGGTITELRCMIDNKLIDKGFVEFRLGYDTLNMNELQDLENAILKYRNLQKEKPQIGSFKGAFNINFE